MLPNHRLILLTLPAAGLLLAGAIVPPLVLAGLLYVLVLGAAAGVDALLLPGRKGVEVRRRFPQRVSLGEPARVLYEVWNRSRRTVEVRIAEDFPERTHWVGEPPVGVFAPGARGTLEGHVQANLRGRCEIAGADVRLAPAPGLLIRQFRLREPLTIEVFPALGDLQRYELLLRRGLLWEQGLNRLRRLGQGTEFESLRAYVPGDEMAKVDWKASAKQQKLVVRNHQPERRQSVLVVIDAGHSAAAEMGGLTRLDYFVSGAVMLAYAAMRQGDWFSLVAFSDRIVSYLPPVRGKGSVERVARALYEVTPQLVAADYAAACRFLDLHHRRRSLICLMTDVVDREASALIIANMARWAHRHLPLAVTLRDPDLQSFYDRPLADADDPHALAAAVSVVSAREEALTAMRKHGVGVLDTDPRTLTPDLIQRYMEIKASHRL